MEKNKTYNSFLFSFFPILLAFIALGFSIIDHQFPIVQEYAFWIYIIPTQAHLLITAQRTHFDKELLTKYRIRFLLIPIFLYCALLNNTIFNYAFLLMIFWDLYHSAMQNFGFLRIFSKEKNIIKHRIDRLFSLANYMIPLLLGNSSEFYFKEVQKLGLLDSLPNFSFSGYILLVYVVLSIIYLFSLKEDQKREFAVSLFIISIPLYFLKNPLYSLFIINIYHAVHYYYIIYKKRNEVLITNKKFIFLSLITVVFAILTTVISLHYIAALLVTTALLHFWYDGFIWKSKN